MLLTIKFFICVLMCVFNFLFSVLRLDVVKHNRVLGTLGRGKFKACPNGKKM
jgi:hypothetical protein